MPKGSGADHKLGSRHSRATPYPLPHCDQNVNDSTNQQKDSKNAEKKDWEDSICSVCMECPHNAVLLLCSSHDKGCRPYMCDTSFRHSNCLDLFKKASTKLTPANRDQTHSSVANPTQEGSSVLSQPVVKSKTPELACPLCRGLVKGWTVVEPAREHLNALKRGCMQDSCSFSGTYRELRKHVRQEHPTVKPRVVDPALQERWIRLEDDRQHEDVVSMVRSSLPGATVVGDYVIEGSNIGFDVNVSGEGGDVYTAEVDADFLNVVFFLNAYVDSQVGNTPRQERRQAENSEATTFPTPGDDFNGYVRDFRSRNSDGVSFAHRLRRQGRMLLGRSERRRRLRQATGDGR